MIILRRFIRQQLLLDAPRHNGFGLVLNAHPMRNREPPCDMAERLLLGHEVRPLFATQSRGICVQDLLHQSELGKALVTWEHEKQHQHRVPSSPQHGIRIVLIFVRLQKHLERLHHLLIVLRGKESSNAILLHRRRI